MTGTKTRQGAIANALHLTTEDVWFELSSVTVNKTLNLAGSRQQLRELGCSIATQRPSDSSEISIDDIGRDKMKEGGGGGRDILPKRKWMVKMDCDKRWKERATSRT